MEDMDDLFFSDPELRSVTLDELDVSKSWDSSDDPASWEFVRARTGSRDTLLYNEDIYRVCKCTTSKPLTDNVDVLTESEILDKMPRNLRDQYVVPSPSGEYLTVGELTVVEKDDGTIRLKKSATTHTIPVEYVKERLSYDEVIVELIDV